MMPEDIGKLFIEDCISKKLISKGVHNRAARRKGFRGKVMFPVDLLKGKEKKAYMGNSDVVTYNLYDNIMPYGDFKQEMLIDIAKIIVFFKIQLYNKIRNK